MDDAEFFKDLESYGIITSNNLYQTLITCQDPVETIKTFQAENSVQLESLKPVMKLLDLHGIRRFEYYENVSNDLTKLLLSKIQALGKSQTSESILLLEKQLEKCFKLYRVPVLKPIVLETLKQLPKIADKYLKLIVCDKEFYESCSITVRQQIWIKNTLLFIEDVNPIIDSYLEEKEKLLFLSDKTPTNFFTCDTTKSRRQWKQIQDLILMVGEKENLYHCLINLIRDRFLESNNFHLCSLRMELSMALHDFNVDHAMKVDSLHDFAWCLDACIRDKHLDSQQSVKLKAFVETNKRETNKLIGDMAMISRDPHVIHFLCSMAVKILKSNASFGSFLPREHAPLQLILKLLTLGVKAMDFLKGELNMQLLDLDCVTRFLPAFSVLIAEDIIKIELQKSTDDVADEFTADLLSDDLADTILDFLQKNEICALLWIYYLTDLLPTKRKIPCLKYSIYRYIQVLPDLANKIINTDPWLHFFIYRLIQVNPIEPLIAEEIIAEKIIDSILINFIKIRHNAKFHLLRLCVHLKSTIYAAKLEDARDALINIYDEITFKTDNISIWDSFFLKEFDKHKTVITSANFYKENSNTSNCLSSPSMHNVKKTTIEPY